MKKIYMLCAVALGMAFAACDEVEESFSTPQTSPQEAPFGTDQVTVTSEAALIDLAALAEAGEGAAVATVAAPEAPEGYKVELVMEIAKTADFANPVQISCTTGADGVAIAPVDVLQDAYYNNITHDPREAKLNARFAAYAVNGTTRVRMGAPDFFYATGLLNIKPFPADKYIADGYTLEIGNGTDWASAARFDFVNTGVSAYDDPEFQLVANFSDADYAAGLKWRIVASSGEVYGPAGASDDAGDLIQDAPAGTLTQGAPLLVKINMLIDTYSYTQAIACYYTPGEANGWSGPASQKLLPDADFKVYSGVVSITAGGFKINPDDDWKDRDMGLSGSLTEGTSDDGKYTVYTGATTGSGDIKVPVPGLYYAEFTAASKALKLTYLPTIGIIGGFNGWAESIALTPSDDFRTWTSAPVEFPDNCGWKIRACGEWDYQWGTSIDALEFNGDDITTAQGGKYVVTVDFSATPYTAVLAKQ